MSNGRLCGYCRLSGHRADKCPEKEALRKEVLIHTPMERKKTLQFLVDNGFGEGATFLYKKNYWDVEPATYILTDANFVRDWQFSNFRNVRYSKKVKFTPRRYVERDLDGKPLDIKYQYDIISVGALAIGANAEQTTVRMQVSAIMKANLADPDDVSRWDYRVPFFIERSNKMFDVSNNTFAANVHIHKRIAGPDSVIADKWAQVYTEEGIPP